MEAFKKSNCLTVMLNKISRMHCTKSMRTDLCWENVNMLFNYIENIKNIFVSMGLDNLYDDLDNCSLKNLKRAVSKIHQELFVKTMKGHESLRFHKLVKKGMILIVLNVSSATLYF